MAGRTKERVPADAGGGCRAVNGLSWRAGAVWQVTVGGMVAVWEVAGLFFSMRKRTRISTEV
ncbi:hypothetical protein [Thermogemmatispora tikiterensis]|uniref:Uncharacterized protein n=1 Tax=Thermogemmatispora tikiterensis TaxID=1825093 RepID=A0A328VQT8_9CHLR|nr:hypothetical protein [Thermogemmatispora tikiterensis]RAQ98073.1 hypothetical protein A4R35_21210 [Thermogemmatispora tikiterensis]